MTGVLKLLMRVLVVGVAVVYLATVVQAQMACPFLSCKGPTGDVWALPFFLSVVGIPATVLAVTFVVERVWPASPAEAVLRYVAWASVVVPMVAAVAFGVWGGLRAGLR